MDILNEQKSQSLPSLNVPVPEFEASTTNGVNKLSVFALLSHI